MSAPGGGGGGGGSTKRERREKQEADRAKKSLSSMSPAAADLYFVRHGETTWNKEGRMQGQVSEESPLTEAGHLQAAALGRMAAAAAPGEGRPDAVYCSDLLRAKQTAEVIAGAASCAVRCGPEIGPGLRERHLGVFQGLTFRECRERHPDVWRALQQGEPFEGGGEGDAQMMDRIERAAETIASAHPGGSAWVVVHGGVLHCLHKLASGAWCRGEVVNGSVHVIRVDPSKNRGGGGSGGGGGRGWAVVEWGRVGHLQGLEVAAGEGMRADSLAQSK